MSHSDVSHPTRRDWVILAAALLLLYAFMLGSRGLNEPDETRYANIALTMLRPPGDWWEPRMSGYGHYDKPPLIYWVTALSFRAFGVNEWAARLSSLCGAIFALAGLGWAAYRLRGARVAWWAVLICGTCAQFWIFGRILSPDMLLTGWCSLAIGAWAEARSAEARRAKQTPRLSPPDNPFLRTKGPSYDQAELGGQNAWLVSGVSCHSWGWWSLSLLFWTLAWWTKATPALVPLLGLTVGVIAIGDPAARRSLRPWLMFPALIALGSPWYLSMIHAYPELKGFFFGRELAGRLAGSVDGRHGAWWYYLPVCLWSWLPWWPVAVWAAWTARKHSIEFSGKEPPPNQETSSSPVHPRRLSAAFSWLSRTLRHLGVEGWIVLVGLLILSLTSSKLHSYTLTLMPWAALLMARTVAAVTALRTERLWQPFLTPAAGFSLVACLGIAMLPSRLETRLGINTSLREVSRFLQSRGAARVDIDRYWSGLEFYLGTDVIHYVLRIDDPVPGDDPGGPTQPSTAKIERYHERDSDPGASPNRFIDPERWPALPPNAALVRQTGGWWFVRFYKRPKRIFDQLLQNPDPARRPKKARRIGDFDVYQMPDLP